MKIYLYMYAYACHASALHGANTCLIVRTNNMNARVKIFIFIRVCMLARLCAITQVRCAEPTHV